MRASLPNLIKALNAQKPPKVIWQKPFDYDASHYKRLCTLQGVPPAGGDLVEYAYDLAYEVSPLQEDLFHFLLPLCLEAWWTNLNTSEEEYGHFVEMFWHGLVKRAEAHLSPSQFAAVDTFMRDSILDAIDGQKGLSEATSYAWFQALNSYATVFPNLPMLWEAWWRMETTGQAFAALYYASCFLYEEAENPIFAPWTPYGRGDGREGDPTLNEDEALIDVAWRGENVAFLENTLTVEYLEERLERAAERVKHETGSTIAEKIRAECWGRRATLQKRLPILLADLTTPDY